MTPTTFGPLELPAHVVRWLHDRAQYEACSLDEAAARSIADWVDFCLYPAEVERSLQLAALAHDRLA